MPKVRLYQFMQANHAISNLEQRRLKVSNIEGLNDPFEFAAFDLSDRAFRKEMQRTKVEYSKLHGVVCFCDKWETPVMWAHYGDTYKGIRLGFDVEIPNEYLIPMQYIPERIKPPRNWKELSRDEWLGLFDEMVRSKFDHWVYEGERRVHSNMDMPDPVLKDPNTGDPLYFMRFDPHLTLRQVIVGHKADPTITRASIKAAIGTLPSKVDVFRSRPSHREFKMVTDENW